MFQRKKAKVAVLITAARVSATRYDLLHWLAVRFIEMLKNDEMNSGCDDVTAGRNDVDWKVAPAPNLNEPIVRR